MIDVLMTASPILQLSLLSLVLQWEAHSCVTISHILVIVVTIVIIYLCPEPKVKPDPETQLALRKTGSETALGGDLKNQNTANTETRLKNSTSQII